ncbi:hypothetical protein GJAV_G00169660 [Gymnothorax javanicus]|nr:hypothetical protein GJAV_G00169660 [Gymnothorax javanicus]
MTNHGDDCYFYYYSTCAKGDSCPFRHCEAAMGSETVCTLWQENRCFRNICKFRHMEIKKKRNEIPCYWENQPAGCQKPHCAFHHEKPRMIDGIFVPPSKVPILRKDVEEEPTVPVPDPSPPAPVPVTTPANPQLRGVIKAETQENMPSPTHPPVVINPADDEDEDEDDQFSEEGDESSSRIVSPRKHMSSNNKDDSLNFGIKTLEEIKLRKALKASLRKAGQTAPCLSQGSGGMSPPSQCNNGSSGEKENIRSFIQPSHFTINQDALLQNEEPIKRRIAERLGKRKVTLPVEQHFIIKKDVPVVSEPALKRTLAERLGRKLEPAEDGPGPVPQRGMKPAKDGLGLGAEPAASDNASNMKPMRDRLGLPGEPARSDDSPAGEEAQAVGEIRVKTLEEIRQEKAARSQGPSPAHEAGTRGTKALSPAKRSTKPPGAVHVKTFSELLQERKRKLAKEGEEELGGRSETPPQGEVAAKKAGVQSSEIRVKTLEEIRKEKAARMQAKVQEVKAEEPPAPPPAQLKRRIMRINKSTAAGADNGGNASAREEKPAAPSATENGAANGKRESPAEAVKVKTFQEIMQEKRLRKQQQQDGQLASGTAAAEASSSSSSSSSTLTEQPPPLSALKQPPTTASPKRRAAATPQFAKPATKATPDTKPTPSPAAPQAGAGSPSASTASANSPPRTKSKETSAAPEAGTGEVATLPCPSLDNPPARGPASKKSPAQTAEAKVRPKLNVKPSVVKSATHVKLGQKRKAAESPRSAVAAVKPLNSAPSAVEDQSPQQLCKRANVKAPESPAPSVSVEADVQVRASQTISGASEANIHRSPSAEQSSTSTDPLFSPAKDPPAAPQSSNTVIKTPSQPKSRRQSTATPRTSGSAPLDDFDELMNEFADDPLDGEMELDPAKDEDDLLLELSEMIDS